MARYGNASCASILLLFADEQGHCLTPRAMLPGFGVGLSMASCLVDLSSTTTDLMEIP